jgi:large subunit ribosomal protein L7/L12
MVAAPAAGGAAPAAGAKEAPSTVNVVLAAAGDKKIAVIKVVREITGLGLKEAKELVDGAPKPVKEGVTPEEAEAIKAKFAESGATIEIK